MEISSTPPPAALTAVIPVAAPTRASQLRGTSPTAPTDDVGATTDTIPASPPDEVLQAMGAAAQTYDQLAAQNKQVGFQSSADGSRVQVVVKDLSGNAISSPLPPSHVFNILDGQES